MSTASSDLDVRNLNCSATFYILDSEGSRQPPVVVALSEVVRGAAHWADCWKTFLRVAQQDNCLFNVVPQLFSVTYDLSSRSQLNIANGLLMGCLDEETSVSGMIGSAISLRYGPAVP
jgi:hypothetical protein